MSEVIHGDAGRIAFLLKGDYENTETYDFLDVVYYNGASYGAKKETNGNPPARDSEYWQILAGYELTKEDIHNILGYIPTEVFAKKSIYDDTSVSMGRKEGSIVGTNSIAYGDDLVASGYESIAFGQKNISSNNRSASFGFNNISSGANAFSSGGSNNAMGNNSASFCERNVSVENFSFSEGCGNIVLGYGSHVENAQNISGAKYVFKISSYDVESKKFVFDDAYTGFTDSFAALETGSKLFIQNVNFINDALTFTVSSIGIDGKSVVVNEDIPESNLDVYLAAIIKSGGNYSGCHSEGRKNISLNNYAHSEGYMTEARGYASHTEGNTTKATGNQSHAEGFETQATGNQSHAEGRGTIANEWAQTVCGKWNATKGGDNFFANPFIVGNGNDTNERSNAFRVDQNGEVYAKGNYNSSGADYAEFIKEWHDGNPDSEERVGYFVTVKDGYLYKANKGDYIVGITSGNPSVVGNSDEEYYWRWERDEFNRIIYEEVEEYVEKTDDEGNIITDKNGTAIMVPTGKMIKRMKQSDNYDSSKQQSYVERKDRPEWDYVGMVGVLPVRDDGTCEVGKFCKCMDGGIATLAIERGFDTYMVIDRVTENIVSVILK